MLELPVWIIPCGMGGIVEGNQSWSVILPPVSEMFEKVSVVYPVNKVL
jgi:hypothetical protein